ncbi:hypothetical protein EG878_17585, partial [Enterococcus faecalis]
RRGRDRAHLRRWRSLVRGHAGQRRPGAAAGWPASGVADRGREQRALLAHRAGGNRRGVEGMTCIVLDLPTGRLSTVDEADAVEAYPDLLADTLFAVVGTDIVPLYTGDVVAGTWRCKIVIQRERPGYAWLRVNGPFDDDVTVRTYADGTLLDTVVLSTRDPVRLSAG